MLLPKLLKGWDFKDLEETFESPDKQEKRKLIKDIENLKQTIDMYKVTHYEHVKYAEFIDYYEKIGDDKK